MSAERMRGVVRKFHADRGYGFVRSGELSLFLHIYDLPAGAQVKAGDLITFDALETEKGLRAVNVIPIVKGIGEPEHDMKTSTTGTSK